mgnify:CR=1 FL=1
MPIPSSKCHIPQAGREPLGSHLLCLCLPPLQPLSLRAPMAATHPYAPLSLPGRAEPPLAAREGAPAPSASLMAFAVSLGGIKSPACCKRPCSQRGSLFLHPAKPPEPPSSGGSARVAEAWRTLHIALLSAAAPAGKVSLGTWLLPAGRHSLLSSLPTKHWHGATPRLSQPPLQLLLQSRCSRKAAASGAPRAA